jgi:hypothetical protein
MSENDYNLDAGLVLGGRRGNAATGKPRNTLTDFKQKLADYCKKKGITSLNRRDRSRLFRQRQELALAGEQGAP